MGHPHHKSAARGVARIHMHKHQDMGRHKDQAMGRHKMDMVTISRTDTVTTSKIRHKLGSEMTDLEIRTAMERAKVVAIPMLPSHRLLEHLDRVVMEDLAEHKVTRLHLTRIEMSCLAMPSKG